MSEPAAYLLGELSDAESAAFERAMAADAALREEVERLRPVVARLHALPAEAWEPPAAPPLRVTGVAAPRRRLVLRPIVAVACAVVLLAIGAAAGLLLSGGSDEPGGGERLALAPLAAPRSAAGRVVVEPGDRVRLDVSGLPPSRSGDFYELWLLGADKRLVSLGSFDVGGDGRASIRLPLPVDPARFAFFDVSREPGDGDPGHSGSSVLRGRTS
jgi:anti-sigma-K factor RskA